jgi:GST-like protein
MAMELWTAATPNGWKVTIMIEELKEAGVELQPIEVHTVDLMGREQFSEEFTALNPNQRIPVLVDGDRNIFESGAILQYLGEKFPSSLFPDDDTRWDILPWVYWQMANLGPAFGNKLSYTRYMDDIPPEKKEHPLGRFNNEAQRLLRMLDKQLEGQPYICGDNLTIADIAAWPWVRGWKWSKINITLHDNVMAWVDRVRARPAVERGITYGFPEDQLDQWTEETKKRYTTMGSSMASNESLASEN